MGHGVSLNNIFLEFICVLSFWDLVGREKNRKQFEQYHILDEFPFEELQKTPTNQIQSFERIAKDCTVLLAEGETTSRCFSREEPFWETIPGHSLRETGKEASLEQR